MRITKIAAVAAVVIAFALATIASAPGQGPDIRIAQLDCVDASEEAGIQELVEIENQGDAPQQLAGWKLQSDPPDTEVFDLVVLGGLAPGASVSIQSGPAAAGVFKWGSEEVFRDGDPTDYVRLVDDTGAVIDEVSCGAVAAPTPTPTPSPTPSPEPPTPGDVPNGGGPPPVSGGGLSLMLIVLLGGFVVAVGVAAIAFPWIGVRPSLVGASSPPRAPRSAAARLALAGIAAVVAVLVLGRRRA